MEKVFGDTDIILNLLSKHEPFIFIRPGYFLLLIEMN